jgi:hypothetical protein
MKEKFLPIKGTNNKYFISNKGNVKNYKNQFLKPTITNCNRKRFGFKNYGSVCVSVLVAMHFLKNPKNKPYVIHKDKNTMNDESTNLKFSYQKEFSLKAIKERRIKFEKHRGKKHWKSRPFIAENKKFHTLRESADFF